MYWQIKVKTLFKWQLFLCILFSMYNANAEFYPQYDTTKVETLKSASIYAYRSKKDYKNYRRTVYNLKKVYPYSQIAKEKLHELDEKYNSFQTDKERKNFIKQIEKELLKEFEAPLRKLTISQGKMLVKLIDRETGRTTFTVIKNFRGGFSAFVWQGLAKMFGNDLKSIYDQYGEDSTLEELLQMCENGTFDNLYYSMFPI